MTDGEQKKLLVALVLMVNQHLETYGDEVDTLSESAGEHAIQALAEYGLMELVNSRLGRWTEAGKKFCREDAGIRDPAPVDRSHGILLVTKPDPKE
jgi:hypothetical protein